MKNKKTILMTTIASLTTAIMIYISGGQIVIASLLGGLGICAIPGIIHLNNSQKNNTTYIQEENNLEHLEEILDDTKEKENNDRVVIAPIKQYNEQLLPELITIDALTQKESVLVRIRKKETEEKIKQPKELKK